MKQIQTDIAVIGGGTSGLAAAIAAAETGAKVTIFEKAPITGGTGNMGMGPFAVETRQQRLKQIPLTREDAFNIFMNYVHWQSDARLVKAYIDKSSSTIEWLEGMGVEFVEPAAYFPGAHFTWHLVKPTTGKPGPQGAATMIKFMTERAIELGIQMLLQTPAREIIKENNRVVGLKAEQKSGEGIEARAKAVIVSSGGFGDSPEFIKKYTGYEWGKDLFSFRIPGLVGEGIKMAWDVGAGSDGMYIEVNYGMPDAGLSGGASGGPSTPPSLTLFRHAQLAVNVEGERFVNEEVMINPTFMGNALSRQKGRCAFSIIDSATAKYFEEHGFELVGSVVATEKIENFDADVNKVLAQGHKNLFAASSIEELAVKAGIDVENLKQTIADYNKACDTGRDGLFHKKVKYLHSVKQPRFYAAKLFPAGYGTRGGIKVNYKLEVVTQEQDIIPGLYAAGVDANAIHGDTYCMMLPGGGMGFALNSGRIAGEHAAAFSLK